MTYEDRIEPAKRQALQRNERLGSSEELETEDEGLELLIDRESATIIRSL